MDAEVHRLAVAVAVRSATGIEALVCLRDVASHSKDDAVSLMRWSSDAVLTAALVDPPPTASKRRHPRS